MSLASVRAQTVDPRRLFEISNVPVAVVEPIPYLYGMYDEILSYLYVMYDRIGV